MSPALIRSLAGARFIRPQADEATTGYSFPELLLLRMASALKEAKIPTAKIITALGNIRATLQPGAVLTTMALAAADNDTALHEVTSEWQPLPGRHQAHTKAGSNGRKVNSSRVAVHPTAFQIAQAHYSRGHALEDSDRAAARAAYFDALNAHSDHLEARINLGRLLHLAGDLKQAEQIYRQAKSSSALLSFNLAILLEDLNREEEAILAYREALARDPQIHDAHFNLSRLHENANQPQDALRHLLAYRRHLVERGD